MGIADPEILEMRQSPRNQAAKQESLIFILASSSQERLTSYLLFKLFGTDIRDWHFFPDHKILNWFFFYEDSYLEISKYTKVNFEDTCFMLWKCRDDHFESSRENWLYSNVVGWFYAQSMVRKPWLSAIRSPYHFQEIFILIQSSDVCLSIF